MVNELKPCPFCGCPAMIRGDFGLQQLGCSNDDCAGAYLPMPAHALAHRTKAIAAWNTRAASSSTAEEGLKEALESQDFYEVCQQYRHAQDIVARPGQMTAGQAFEFLKDWILARSALKETPVDEEQARLRGRENYLRFKEQESGEKT
jgi:hypothetical protein